MITPSTGLSSLSAHFCEQVLASSRFRSASQLRSISTRLFAGGLQILLGLQIVVGGSLISFNSFMLLVFIENRIDSASWINCLYLTSASRSAFNSAFSLSEMARILL
uniref:(northern house mosquito) hypothetical protein n=1 Tax=Culex pipiens TaxID=7175 RepID=A0A8D8C807_CULPI